MPRLIYLHQYFQTPAEGGGTRSYEFAKRLAAAGYDVQMVTTDRSPNPGRGWSQETMDGFVIHRIGVPYSNHMGKWRRIAAFTQFALAASLKARHLNGDIVFATSTPLTIGFPGVAATLFRRAPLIFEVRDLWPEMPIALGFLKGKVQIAAAQWFERFIYRYSRHIVALSPGMRDGIVRIIHDSAKVTVIPNSCDLDQFPAPPSDIGAWLDSHPTLKGRQIVLYAGTMGAVNGVDWIVRLAEAVRPADPSIAFVLMGDGADRAKAEQLAKDRRLLGVNVFFLPPVPKHDVACALGAASLALSVFLPIKEMEANSANKFFDALAAGRPVAINYGGWQLELLQEHGAGVRLDAHDLNQSAQDVVKLLGDPARLQAMGRSARLLAETVFARDALGHVLIGLLGDSERQT